MSLLAPFQINYVIGDVKPIVFTGVTSSTGGTLISGTWTLLNRSNDAVLSTGALNVSGSAMNTGLITWGTIGVYLVRTVVTFSDGVIDNTITAIVTISAAQV